MSSAAHLAARFDRLANDLPQVNRLGVNEAARAVAKSALATLTVATGGDLKLSGTRNSKLGVHVDEQSQEAASVAAIVKGIPGGLVSWMESGTKKHVIGAGRGKTAIAQSLRGKKRIYAIGTRSDGKETKSYRRKILSRGKGSGFIAFGPFLGGGVKPKHGFTNGVNAAIPFVPKIIEGHSVKLLKDTFR